MNWTDTLPDQPGHYWCQIDVAGKLAKASIVEIYGHHGDLWVDFGRDSRMRLAGLEARWYGPIQPPPDDTLHIHAQRIYGDLSILDGEVE
jgi:hypothetical protein